MARHGNDRGLRRHTIRERISRLGIRISDTFAVLMIYREQQRCHQVSEWTDGRAGPMSVQIGLASTRSWKRNRSDRAAVPIVASVIRRIGGRKSHPEFHRVLANTSRLGIVGSRATATHPARPHQFVGQFGQKDGPDSSEVGSLIRDGYPRGLAGRLDRYAPARGFRPWTVRGSCSRMPAEPDPSSDRRPRHGP